MIRRRRLMNCQKYLSDVLEKIKKDYMGNEEIRIVVYRELNNLFEKEKNKEAVAYIGGKLLYRKSGK
jgi:hypothetical protein